MVSKESRRRAKRSTSGRAVMSETAKVAFTQACTTQCFLVPPCFHALCKSFATREISSHHERRSDPAQSAAGPANWGS